MPVTLKYVPKAGHRRLAASKYWTQPISRTPRLTLLEHEIAAEIQQALLEVHSRFPGGPDLLRPGREEVGSGRKLLAGPVRLDEEEGHCANNSNRTKIAHEHSVRENEALLRIEAYARRAAAGDSVGANDKGCSGDVDEIVQFCLFVC